MGTEQETDRERVLMSVYRADKLVVLYASYISGSAFFADKLGWREVMREAQLQHQVSLLPLNDELSITTPDDQVPDQWIPSVSHDDTVRTYAWPPERASRRTLNEDIDGRSTGTTLPGFLGAVTCLLVRLSTEPICVSSFPHRSQYRMTRGRFVTTR